MKSKTKSKSEKSVSTKKSATKQSAGNYPAYYLAVALAGILLLEGLLLGAATPQAWSEAVQILDVSSSVQAVTADMAFLFEPMFNQVAYTEDFYQMAATEVIYLFDVSDHDPLVFIKGVSEFYYLASVEMESLLDLSDSLAFMKTVPQVAGAAVFK
jgi:hypothetical protein